MEMGFWMHVKRRWELVSISIMLLTAESIHIGVAWSRVKGGARSIRWPDPSRWLCVTQRIYTFLQALIVSNSQILELSSFTESLSQFDARHCNVPHCPTSL